MNLSEFPRPREDSGVGVHGSLSCYWASSGQQDWDFWAEQLRAMKIKWYKVVDDGGGSAWPLVMRLLDMEIMPVIRFYWPQQNPGNIGSRGGDAAKAYIQEGAMYFECNNEPDLDLEWKDGKKPPNWLDIVVDNFIIDADIIMSVGGDPAMPAFGVGTQRDPFRMVVNRGRRDILDNGAWASLHNYCLARPLAYPNDPINTHGKSLSQEDWVKMGGAWAWEMGVDAVNDARTKFANPDASIQKDATCFRAYEWLNEIIVGAIGHSIPIMTTEGGYNVGQRAGTTFGDDARYPKPTPEWGSQMNLEMFRFMQGDITVLGNRVPNYYFACMPWLIAVQRMFTYAPPAENQGPWFTDIYNQDWDLDPEGELPLVQYLKDLPPRVRQDGPVPAPWDIVLEADALGDAWDFRLDFIGVTYEPFTEEGPVWKLVEAKWEDETESGGACSIFVRVLDDDGTMVEGVMFDATREDGVDQALTKGAVDGYWGNITMYGSLGTYTVHVGGRSDRVVGVGFGVERPPHPRANTSFRLTFQLMQQGPPAPTPLLPIDESKKALFEIRLQREELDDIISQLERL